MSNSSLVTHIKLSPNCSRPRLDKIDSIVIHHMAGVLTVEQCGNVFASTSRQASSNYGVDSNGNVGLYVEEKDRSWATSSPIIDNRAVTIEVANDKVGGDWHVSDTALQKTIELCADICKRNGIKKLNYTGDKSGNLQMHRWYASTNCPGDYLASKFPYIADEVNKRLNGGLTVTQYEELKKQNEELKQKVDNLVTRYSTYQYLNKELNSIAPDAFEALQKAVDKGVLGYGEDGFTPGLTKDMIRIIIYMYRLGLFE